MINVHPIVTWFRNTEGELIKYKIGVRILFDDCHSDLRHGQWAWKIKRPLTNRVIMDECIFKDYQIHGTIVTFNKRHQSFSVTSPCMPHRDRLHNIIYHRSRVVVYAPNKFTGMPVDQFVKEYGNFGDRVFRVLKMEGEL